MLTPFQTRAARALGATPVFGELDPAALRLVRRRAIRRGELLFAKGDPSDHLFGVISGQLKVFSAPAPGRQVALELVAPGELVGDLGIEDGGPRYASVVALAHSELAAIARCDLDELLRRQPALHVALHRAGAGRARRLAERAEDVAFLSIEARIEKALDDLAARCGEAVARGTRIRVRQQDLAEVLGISRESVSRALGSPALRARVEIGRGHIVLLRA